ncbi:conserved hypothetical protein [Nostocoides japonicum T1-X7]|uniref:VOC domain-containing protein n=1 Tax=Nostocoides japonicum T1-X7 TaxID=1194083 RepID=A0A077LWX2_9MICO|nr:conserved hypothetical protein [Tetrasphaera japonica T1-X7]
MMHFEIPFDDGERATTFYRDVFGWTINAMPQMEYALVTTGPTGDAGPTEPGFVNGGMLQRCDVVPTTVVTLVVDDIVRTLAQVEAAGGRTVRDRQPVGDMGFAAYATDTEGNVIGLWEDA